MGRGWLVVPVVLTAVLTGVLAASQLMQARTNPPNIDVNILIDRLIPEDFDFTKLSKEDEEAIISCVREQNEKWDAAGYANTTIDPPPDEILLLPGEYIKIWGCPDRLITYQTFIQSPPVTSDELRDFIRRRIFLLKAFAEGAPDYRIDAWVSPVKPLTEKEYDELVSRHGLEIVTTTFKYMRKDTGEVVATGGGFGFLTSPPEHRLKTLQEELLPPGVELEYRITSFSVSTTAEALLKLQKDPLILIVDFGPLDIIYQYAKQGAVVYFFGPRRLHGAYHVLTAALSSNIDQSELYRLKEYANILLNG